MGKSTGLTDKQERFVQELIKGKSQREAYRIAYPKSQKWSEKVIDTQASILFNNSKVLVRYNELRDRLLKEAEDECIVTAKDVLREIKSIAFDDISNYLDFRNELTQVGENPTDGSPIVGYKTIVDIKDSRTINTKNISEISVGRDGQFKFKLYSRDNALYKLADILGLGKESQDTTDKEVKINIEYI